MSLYDQLYNSMDRSLENIQRIITFHLEKYPQQFEFMKGDESQGLHLRLETRLNEKYGKKRNGKYKTDKYGTVKFKRRGLLPRTTTEQDENIINLLEELRDTHPFMNTQCVYKKEDLIDLANPQTMTNLLKFTVNLFSYLFFNTDFFDLKSYEFHPKLVSTWILRDAERADSFLQHQVKPYILDQIQSVNYRQNIPFGNR